MANVRPTAHLLDLLFNEFELAHKPHGGSEPSIEDFVNWGKNYLTNVNRPLYRTYHTGGAAVMMQNGQLVELTDRVGASSGENNMLPDTSVPITNMQTHPKDINASAHIPIT